MRRVFGGLVVLLLGLVVYLGVWRQLQINSQLLRLRDETDQRSVRTVRVSIDTLDPAAADPYLRGQVMVARARGLALLGRDEEAGREWDRAMDQRIFGSHLVEAGLFHLEHGNLERAEELLIEAARLSPLLVRFLTIPSPELRDRVLTEAERPLDE